MHNEQNIVAFEVTQSNLSSGIKEVSSRQVRCTVISADAQWDKMAATAVWGPPRGVGGGGLPSF
jgi:hypothetical protein